MIQHKEVILHSVMVDLMHENNTAYYVLSRPISHVLTFTKLHVIQKMCEELGRLTVARLHFFFFYKNCIFMIE